MDKKATRRIIGVLVVIALVIILLPLFNTNDSQSTAQTAEIKAPPFPNSQSQPDPSDTIATANNDARQDPSTVRSWFSKLTNKQETPAPVAPVKPVLVAQNTVTSPTQQFVNNNNNANSGTITPPKQDTMIANSSLDGEEEIEQDPNSPINNVVVSNNDAPATTANQPTAVAAPQIAPPPNTSTTGPALPAPTAEKKPADTTAVKTPVAVIAPTPAKPAPIVAVKNSAPLKTPVIAENILLKASIENSKPQPLKTPVVAQNIPLKSPVVETTHSERFQTPVLTENKPVEETVKPVPLKTPVVATITTVKTSVHTAEAKLSQDLNQLKKTAWVVQMGSFKSKVNAEHLTNALRAKGYKAFTYQTKSNGQTRVYIGPEFKQGSAVTIASRVQSDMKLHGIVVSFEPLEL